MLKWIETTGRSEEDAIAAALFQLGMDRDDVSVEVIERAKSAPPLRRSRSRLPHPRGRMPTVSCPGMRC